MVYHPHLFQNIFIAQHQFTKWNKLFYTVMSCCYSSKNHLATATNCMKQTADKKRRDVSFQEGDMVFLRLQPYRQSSAFKRVHQKLASRLFGPYPILQKVGNVAYKLQLPEGVRIHPIFHVSLLKKYVGDATDTHTNLPPVSDKGEVVLEPEAILDHRWVKQGGKFLAESLVKWKHLPSKEATCEVTESLCHQFPHLNLEDKVPLSGGVLISHEDLREQQSRIPSIVKCKRK
jgi:hypothetical protein